MFRKVALSLTILIIGTIIALWVFAQHYKSEWETCNSSPTFLDKAIEACDQIIKLPGENALTKAIALTNRGHALAWKEDYESALRDYDQAIDLAPGQVPPLYGRGNAYGGLGKHDLAIKDLDEAIRLNPKYAGSWNSRCWEYAMLGQYDHATSDCTEALRLLPNDAPTLDSLGFIELKRRNYKAAIAYYDAAIKYGSEMASPWYCRGIAKLRNGDIGGGNEDIAEAKKLLPNIVEIYAKKGLTQ